MEQFLIPVAANAVTTAIGIAVGWAMGGIRGAARARDEARRQAVEDRDTVRRVLRTLLYCRLADMHRRYVVGGEPCTPAEKQEAEEVYTEYHECLGGNGARTQLYQEIMAAHVA